MLPSACAFERAIETPTKYFRCLQHIQPHLHGGRAVVRRTYLAVEAEVEWEGRDYLLLMPFHRESLTHIEELAAKMQDVEAAFLCRCQIFYNEMLVVSSGGETCRVDVILQELPDGVALSDRSSYFSVAELSYKISELANEMRRVGFCHNNLRPENVVVGRDGSLHLLRYWYAEFGADANDDFSTISETLGLTLSVAELHDVGCGYEAKSKLPPLRERDGMVRFCRNGKFGFCDGEGAEVVASIYSYACDFEEGRAVVADEESRMGVIDKEGVVVVPIIYDDIVFDMERGVFFAYKGDLLYTIDYCGELLAISPIQSTSQQHTEVLGKVGESRH